MLRRTQSRFFASALAASAILAAGCGGGGGSSSGASAGSSADPAAVLSSIKIPTANQGPQKIDLKLTITTKGTATNPQIQAFTSKPISVSLTGATEGTKGDLTYTVNAGPIAGLTGGLRVLDGKSWVQVGGTWYELPASTTSGTSTTSTSIDPKKLLDSFGKPDQYIKDAASAGSEKIGDLDTDHIKGNLDIPAFLEATVKAATTLSSNSSTVTPDQLAKAKTAIQKVITKSTADVWVGKDDKFVHKLSVDMSGVIEGATKTQTGLDGFDANISIQATPTTSVTVEAPAGAKPAAELQKGLGGLLGGLSGSLSTTP